MSEANQISSFGDFFYQKDNTPLHYLRKGTQKNDKSMLMMTRLEHNPNKCQCQIYS